MRYDIYPNQQGRGFLLDVQADLLEEFNTRVVVPLLPLSSAPKPAKRLNPTFVIKGEGHMMATQYLAAVPTTLLSDPVENAENRQDEIRDALDMVFSGF